MQRRISQRELRNDSGEIMRAIDRGDSFVVTRNGVPLAHLEPMRPSYFTSAIEAIEMFQSAPALDAARFRSDLDAFTDPDPKPRA